MKIQGTKISLRSIKSDDFEHTIRWRDDQNLRFQGQFHPFPISKELEKEWCGNIVNDRSNKNVSFAVEINDGTIMIGYLQLKSINWINNTCVLGIIIGDLTNRGQGYGREALSLGLQYAFESLNMRKISLEVLTENSAAISLYEKCGFREEGIRKDHVYYHGTYWDVLLMALFKSEYKKCMF